MGCISPSFASSRECGRHFSWSPNFSCRLDLHHNKTCVALANLWWSIGRNRIENRTYPDGVMFIESVHLLTPCLNAYVFLTCWAWSGSPDSKMWFNLFETCVFMVFVVWSSPTHVLLEYRGPIKKRNQKTPTYLIPTKTSLAYALGHVKVEGSYKWLLFFTSPLLLGHGTCD